MQRDAAERAQIVREEKRRIKAIRIHPDNLLAAFINPQFRKPHGDQEHFTWTVLQFIDLPEDTQVVGGGWDARSCDVLLFLYHQSFPVLPEGAEAPLVESKVRKITTNTKGEVVFTQVHEHRQTYDQAGFQTSSNWRENPLL